MTAASTRWNLVMITLDCVRPDHLGCYGYPGVETPRLDSLASQGILFEQAVTHAPNTWVAHACLFSGGLPARHGLRAATHRLSPHVVTLAEWLSGNGYATAAFPGTSLVGRAQGFHRGFDYFDEAWQQSGTQAGEILWRRNWSDTLNRMGEWVETMPEPFFLWVHYVDTHHLPEWDLPDYFRRQFSPRWQHYDGKISHADQACIGGLLDLLEKGDLRKRTIVAVFSDHGEELRHDDQTIHDGGLKDSVIRIPLILSLPPAVGRMERRPGQQVRLLDLYPTLCDLLNLSRPRGLQGRSLLTLIQGQPPEGGGENMAYLENWPKGYLGLRTPEWKLILQHRRVEDWGRAEPTVEGLYHLPTDPAEETDLSGRHPSTLQHLREACLRWGGEGAAVDLEPEERRKVEGVLKGLGYL